jgi:hypothetical protein
MATTKTVFFDIGVRLSNDWHGRDAAWRWLLSMPDTRRFSWGCRFKINENEDVQRLVTRHLALNTEKARAMRAHLHSPLVEIYEYAYRSVSVHFIDALTEEEWDVNRRLALAQTADARSLPAELASMISEWI